MATANKDQLLQLFSADSIVRKEILQELWSGYGEISRDTISGGKVDSVIIKKINLKSKGSHPKDWNTNASHQRKLKSYQIECKWYRDWSMRCNMECRIPELYDLDSNKNEILLVLEDLDIAGFPLRMEEANLEIVKLGLKWLANFHANFIGKSPEGLWAEGTYWHLSTRKDEWKNMADGHLKQFASVIAKQLKDAKYQTILHGDAKLANFCFSEDGNQIAAVDFQYVGGGCGIKDVAYFLSSCFESEQLFEYADGLLDFYFKELNLALLASDQTFDYEALEEEWRALYPFAWADFTRFLKGWSPDHWKLHEYSRSMVSKTISQCVKTPKAP